jgi:carbohydrate diacid regulator
MRKGQELKIDITLPRRVMIISIRNSCHEDNIKESCIYEIQKQSPNNIVFENLNVLIVLLHNRPDNKMKQFANKISEKFTNSETKLFIGIDEGYQDILKINNQYSKAMKALVSCSHMSKRSICFYNELNIELVLEEIPLGLKQLYINKIFKDYSKEEIKNTIRVIKVFYEEDGSIKRASEKLNIHPNTLQYKLKKIKLKTGYDPRKLKYAATFTLVDQFLFEIENI